MTLSNDYQARMSYLRLLPETPVHRTEVLEEDSVAIDYDSNGRIIGIELFGNVEGIKV
ncbi:MAG: DUF2283 domain-containing protein [Halioglobus sp.]